MLKSLEGRYLAQVNGYTKTQLASCTVQAFHRLQMDQSIIFPVVYGKHKSYIVLYYANKVLLFDVVQLFFCTFALMQTLRPLRIMFSELRTDTF